VYAQVTSLFSSAPDLLEDFKQFLPESAAQHRAAQQQAARHAAEDAVMLSNVRGEQTYQPAPPHQHQTPRTDTSRLPPMGNFAPTPTANRDNKRKRGERQAPGVSSSAIPTSMVGDAGSANARAGYGQGNLAKVREETFIHILQFFVQLLKFRLFLNGARTNTAYCCLNSALTLSSTQTIHYIRWKEHSVSRSLLFATVICQKFLIIFSSFSYPWISLL
jgi:Paired amphipathic helix repeat